MSDAWLTGWPHEAAPSAMVEVEYRDGTREIAEVCEVDWSRHDPGYPWSPSPEREVVRYRMTG